MIAETHTPNLPVPDVAPRRRRSIASARDYSTLIAVGALFLTLCFSSAVFFTERNLLNVLNQWTPVALMALGGTVVVIVGGFDLSVGSIFVLSGVVAAKVATSTSAEVGIVAGLAVGVACGLSNGLLITFGRMNDFVATIGTLIAYSGLAVAVTGGFTISVDDPDFGWLGRTAPLGIQLSIWILAAAIAATSFLLAATVFGRRARAVGGNLEAARLSGVRTSSVIITAYLISGLSAGIAAVLLASRSLSAIADTSSGAAFQVWTAILVGGNSLVGGAATIWRSVVGVVLLALIANGFNLLGVSPTYQQVVTGGILLASVGIDGFVRSRKS
jgi:ribose transport system permease protein